MNGKRAFTLIELLVVIIIMGLLAAVLQPMLSGSSAKSREVQCESNLHHIGMALHIYAEDYSRFPDDLEQIVPVLRGRSMLNCPSMSENAYYYYANPGPDALFGGTLAACADPKQKRYPHRLGECYLELSAGGEVRAVLRR